MLLDLWPIAVIDEPRFIDFIQNAGTGTVLDLTNGVFFLRAVEESLLNVSFRLQRRQYAALRHTYYVALTFRAGTKVQGFEKRELSDPWVPAQLWVINEVEQGVYTIQNTNSRTFADLSGSMSMIISLTLSHSSTSNVFLQAT